MVSILHPRSVLPTLTQPAAGITLEEINGSQTSVFCGCFTNDYNAMVTKDLEYYPKYTVTGQYQSSSCMTQT